MTIFSTNVISRSIFAMGATYDLKGTSAPTVTTGDQL
jgi:hypothetical protein